MKFALNRVVHFYYLLTLVVFASVFSYGVLHYWKSGILNIEFVSGVYDGTNKVKVVKDRNDLEEIKKFVDGDRLKDASKLNLRLEQDIKDLKFIKNTEDNKNFEENNSKFKSVLVGLQNGPELSTILTTIIAKISNFEAFVTEKKWPTLTRMSVALRNKTSQAKIVSNGMYSFDRILNLSMSINNDLEAMTNFSDSSGLKPEIKSAINNRIKTLRSETEVLNNYIEEHKKFNKVYKEFNQDYQTWFKDVEPEIAFKKMQFEKNSQSIIYSIIGFVTILVLSIIVGIFISNFMNKLGNEKIEKLVLDTIKENVIPVESKNNPNFSKILNSEIAKYHDQIHRRMTFGAMFQEAMPFASILLDSNLNLVWGNQHFYEEWRLENFKDEDDTLTWDFLQRFTNLDDNSSILNALRMSRPGVYNIKVKTTSMDDSVPYEMHVSPIDYSGQKRIMIVFYSTSATETRIVNERNLMIDPTMTAMQLNQVDSLTEDHRIELYRESEKHNGGNLFKAVFSNLDIKDNIIQTRNAEIEKLERIVHDQNNQLADIRKLLVNSYETQRNSADEFNKFKTVVSGVIDSRDQIEEQYRFTMNASRELYKDQNKILQLAEKAEVSVDEYVKSLKNITGLKSQFKELKGSVEEFKLRIIQVLDQLLIFQNHEGDSLKIDQFLGKIKIEMKGFEKILYDFNQVVTQLDVTVTKIDLMVEGRERVDLKESKYRMDTLKNNIENVQFSVSKIGQQSHLRDEELVNGLKTLVANLKTEMKRVNDMCKVTGLTDEYLNAVSPKNEMRT
jgi:hypothetical protein